MEFVVGIKVTLILWLIACTISETLPYFISGI